MSLSVGPDDFTTDKAPQHQTEEIGHGRTEQRTYVQMPVPKHLHELEQWKGLRTIGLAVSAQDDKETTEICYFILRYNLDALRVRSIMTAT
jgi:hypothetical protein